MLAHVCVYLSLKGREIAPLATEYIRHKVAEQRKEEEAKGIVRELSFI